MVSTKGLDEDLTPKISPKEKRQWYYDLEHIYQEYLKGIFNINEFEKIGFAVDFYECRFILKKRVEIKEKEAQLGVYMTEAIALQRGQKKSVDGKYPFVYKVALDRQLPEELIINPIKYSANEKPMIKTKESEKYYFPFLELKKENAT